MRISSRARRSRSARRLVTAEEIIEFASEFDAQPMHLDEAAGKASILGGLSASGWHTCAMFMRLLCDGFLLEFDLAGLARHRLCEMEEAGAGRRHAEWQAHRAQRPHLEVAAAASASSTIRSELVNQRGEQVFELQNTGMFLTREAAQ